MIISIIFFFLYYYLCILCIERKKFFVKLSINSINKNPSNCTRALYNIKLNTNINEYSNFIILDIDITLIECNIFYKKIYVLFLLSRVISDDRRENKHVKRKNERIMIK